MSYLSTMDYLRKVAAMPFMPSNYNNNVGIHVTDADYAPLPHVAKRRAKAECEYVTHSELELLFDYDYQRFEAADQEYPGCDEAVTITGIYFREIDLMSEYTGREIEQFESDILEQHS